MIENGEKNKDIDKLKRSVLKYFPKEMEYELKDEIQVVIDTHNREK